MPKILIVNTLTKISNFLGLKAIKMLKERFHFVNFTRTFGDEKYLMNIGRRILQQTPTTDAYKMVSKASQLSPFNPLQEYKTINSEHDMKSMLLNFLVVLVIMFTFFAIVVAMSWLISMYVLKRLRRKKVLEMSCNVINEFDVTEL